MSTALSAVEAIKRWLIDYVLEWQLTDRRQARNFALISEHMVALINNYDILCFVKPGGLCPFCNMAQADLQAYQETHTFSLHIATLLDEEREVMRLMLNSLENTTGFLPTYPTIFVRGRRLAGGYTELKAMSGAETGSLDEALEADPHILPTEVELAQTSPHPLLRHQAGGGPWLGFQVCVYGNIIRMIALFQVVLLGMAHFVFPPEKSVLYIPFMAILFVDSFLFVVFGPTPFTPLGVLSTLLVWHRRGSVVKLVPYKVTFSFYAISSLATILCNSLDAHDGAVCKVLRSDTVIYTLFTNSIYLLIFRF
jgi:glutaredoxin-related protein